MSPNTCAPSTTSDSAASTPRILIVEDDDSTQEFLATLLRNKGYDPVLAASGEEGLERLAAPDGIRAVLLDLMIPGASGFDVLRQIRATPATAKLPVLILTARDSTDDRVRALEMGANDYVTKPFEAPELLARLESHLRERELNRELERRLEQLETTLDHEKRLAEALETRNDELARLSTLKDQFISIASHDLRSPLTNIRGYTDLLLQGALGRLNEDQREALQVILRNCAHLLETLGKLLDVSRLDAGEMRLSLSPNDLVEMATTALTSHTPQAEGKGIVLEAKTLPPLPPVLCDHERITSVMNNLLSNAIKFCHKGDTVTMELTDGGEEAVFRVRDTGPGVPKEEQPKLFSRFARLSPRPTGGEKSVGLGLALVKEIVELHGGRVEVESKPGAGTAFTVRLPYKGPPDAGCTGCTGRH